MYTWPMVCDRGICYECLSPRIHTLLLYPDNVVEPQEWELPYIERIEEINQEARVITIDGLNDSGHNVEIFAVCTDWGQPSEELQEGEPTLAKIRALNGRLQGLGAQVIQVHWHGGWDEELQNMEGPNWTIDVLISQDVNDDDVIREAFSCDLELNPLHMGYFRTVKGIED